MFLLTTGSDTLDLEAWDDGFIVSSHELTAPSARTVSADRPGRDGTTDTTELVGSRALTVNVAVGGTETALRVLMDRLAPFLHPRARTTVWFGDPGSPVRRLVVRREDHSEPWVSRTNLDVVLAFRTVGSPWPIGSENKTVFVAPFTPEVGRAYPLTFPRTYPPSTAPVVVATNDGDQPASMVAQIYGPVTSPRLRNETTGEELSFPGLVIAEGDFVEIDSDAHTVRANGDPGASRYSFLDILGSTWWEIQPGDNVLTMPNAAFAAPAGAQVAFSDTWYS